MIKKTTQLLHTITLVFAWLAITTSCSKDHLELDAEFLVSKDLNKTNRGYSAPVILKVFQLSSLDKMHSASFVQIFDDASKALEGTLIEKQEIELVPRSSKQFVFEVSKDTAYLVLLAGFRKGERGNWRLVLPMTKDTPSSFSVGLKSNEIYLLDDEGAGMFLNHEVLNEAPSRKSFDKYRGKGRR